MSPHPLTESFLNKATGIAFTLFAGAVLWLLMILYGNLGVLPSLFAAFAYILILALAGYLYWYIADYIKTVIAKAILAAVIQFVCLSGTFLYVFIFEPDNTQPSVTIIPLCLVYGLLWMIILEQWYDSVLKNQQIQQLEDNLRVESVQSEKGEIIERISVKEGSKIHIVSLEELLYFQAYGDYVILYTDNGKYLKEQTMKFYETNLPSTFVRIHRSCIVNSEKIARVELYGKESYNVYLKNGTSVRASTSGYKLLKEKLFL